jgi:hypothetical protein
VHSEDWKLSDMTSTGLSVCCLRPCWPLILRDEGLNHSGIGESLTDTLTA